MLLRDLRDVFAGADKMSTKDILEGLVELDELPWGGIGGKELDARGLAQRLGKYGIKPNNIRTATGVAKGYDSGDFHDMESVFVPSSGPFFT